MYGIKPECLICYCVAGFRHGFLAAISADISPKIFAITSRALWCHVALSQLIIIACFVMLSAPPTLVSADDTDIYLGESGRAKHNVLFILDLSDSMNSELDPPNAGRTALEVLRETLRELIRGLDHLQVGLMRMNGLGPGVVNTIAQCTQAIRDIDPSATDIVIGTGTRTACLPEVGGSVLYPVTDLDAPVTIAAEAVSVAASVASNEDDVAVSAPPPPATEADSLNLGGRFIFLRFDNVPVPQGATVSSAFVDFTAFAPASPDPSNPDPRVDDNQATLSGGPAITIRAENIDDAPESPPSFASRTYTSETVLWGGFDANTWAGGSIYSTIDIKNVIEAVVERPGWCGGNALVLRFDPNLSISRHAQSFEGGTAPVLRINYEPVYDTDDTGCAIRELNIPVAGPNSDGLAVRNSFRTDTRGALMLFGRTGESYYGVQFLLPVEQGTTIDSATLEIRIDENSPGNAGPISMDVSMENDVNPGPFNLIQVELPNRQGSATFVSGAPIWTDLEDYSLDVTSVIQQQLNKALWQADNPVSFIVFGIANGSALRRIVGFERGPSQAARLRVNIRQNFAVDRDLVVRDDLISTIARINNGFTLIATPTVGTLYEAALYWRGEDVTFGNRRGTALLGTQILGTNPINGNPVRIDYTGNMSRILTSHPDSWQNGSYVAPTGQTAADCQRAYSPDCARDRITDATYISPIDSDDAACAANFQILVTDGVPTGTVSDWLKNEITAEFDDLTDCSTDPAVNEFRLTGRCAVEMLKEMSTDDQNSDLPGRQTVTTHVLSFARSGNEFARADDSTLVTADGTRWLEQLAAAGGGQYYEANSPEELKAALENFTDNVATTPSTFAAPAISANAFNRLFSRDNIYFGLFEPAVTAAWHGNVKKYNVCVDITIDEDGDGQPDYADCDEQSELGDVLDKSHKVAVTDGVFIDSTTSVWSSEEDGGQLRVGGTGGEIGNINERTIYTDENKDKQTTTASLNTAGYELKSDNWSSSDLEHIHAEVCPAPSNSDLSAGSECETRMLWLLGRDVFDEDGDNDKTDLRWWFADVLHSSPVAITYGLDKQNVNDPADDKFIDRILVGTNEGGLHMINGDSGKEEWTFIPVELFDNFEDLYDNAEANAEPPPETADHVYGMDLTPAVRLVDNNNDGIIKPSDNDKVHVYSGMRRGGTSYYALDITPAGNNELTSVNTRVEPKLLWRIRRDGVDPGAVTLENDFRRLGQTWSEPVIADIRCYIDTNCPDGHKTVLIFGGGYDGRLDDNFAAAVKPNAGNAIYVVDADNGKIIFWISHDEVDDGTINVDQSAADIKVPEMLYSIMSRVTVIDSDGDGFDDRIYVGDAGGQVWRVDLGSDIKVGSDSDADERFGSTVVGRLADISDSSNSYNFADQRRFHYQPAVAQVYDTVYSTTGEFDYVVIASGDRADPLGTKVRDRLYAFRDLQTTPMTVDPATDGLAQNYPIGNSGDAITEAKMTDVTTRVLDGSDLDVRAALGWFYSFDTEDKDTGQKGLSAPIIVAGTVLVTSYLPDEGEEVGECGAPKGRGVAHNFNILNTAATQNWEDPDEDPDDPIANRSSELGSGIPSEVIPIFTRQGVTLAVGTGQGPENLGTITGLPRFRTYWSEQEISF